MKVPCIIFCAGATNSVRLLSIAVCPHQEMPQQKQLDKTVDPEALCLQAAVMLNCHLEHLRKSGSISKVDKADQDLLIYLLWQLGQLTSQKIGKKFGLTYSAVSRGVGVFNELLRKNNAQKTKLSQVKSQIKI